MKYFIISDPHGFYYETMAALREAGWFACAQRRLILLGDALDRGEAPELMIEFLLSVQAAGELIYIRGNHEDLFLDLLCELEEGRTELLAEGVSHHVANGTLATALALAGHMPISVALSRPKELAAELRRTLFYTRLLPHTKNYYETCHYVFVHGWIPATPSYGNERDDGRKSFSYDPAWRTAPPLAWRYARWYNGMKLLYAHGVRVPKKTVFCGHVSASFGHSMIEGCGSEWGVDAVYTPFAADGLVAMDACTALSGFVNCAVVEDEPLEQ